MAARDTELGDRIRSARTGAGLSRTELAKRTGLTRRAVASFETGRTQPEPAHLVAIGAACGTDGLEAVDLELVVPGGTTPDGRTGPARGDDAQDALLREYVSMVMELRSSLSFSPQSLRQEDLNELATALGGTPDAIETRIMELLGSDEYEAHRARTTILPSLGTDDARLLSE